MLGVRIDEITQEIALERVLAWLCGTGQHTIFTPNPEMLVDAQRDQVFRSILNTGSLNICDGKGTQLLSQRKLIRIPGIEFMSDICVIAEESGKSVYLLGSGDKEVIAVAAKNLQEKFPRLKIVGYHEGPAMNEELTMNNEQNERVIDDIIAKAPEILFVGFGHVKQEKWIDAYLKELPSVKIAMGVGGSFDMLGGKVRRAPKFMRLLGLEWLWRLCVQPWRVKRIWKATVVFLFLVLCHPESRHKCSTLSDEGSF